MISDTILAFGHFLKWQSKLLGTLNLLSYFMGQYLIYLGTKQIYIDKKIF